MKGFFGNTQACTAGNETLSCTSRCGMSSADSANRLSSSRFDESGEVRTLYPTARDQFFAGPGAAVSTSIEAQIEFQRDGAGKITSLSWRRGSAPTRVGRRVEIEKREDVRFSSRDVQLTGMVISPTRVGNIPRLFSYTAPVPRIGNTCFLGRAS